jgi:hypothetical protein
VRGQRHAPAALYPLEKTRYPLYRRLGGLQGRSGQVRKISPPPGFDLLTVQPATSRYTNYATRPTPVYMYFYQFVMPFVSNSKIMFPYSNLPRLVRFVVYVMLRNMSLPRRSTVCRPVWKYTVPKLLVFFRILLSTFSSEPPVFVIHKDERSLSLVQGHSYGFHLRVLEIDDIGPGLFNCIVRTWRRQQKLYNTCELVFTYDPLGKTGPRAGRTGRHHCIQTPVSPQVLPVTCFSHCLMKLLTLC